jgi:quercetin dioxygenase-like cupin family protein
MHADSLPAPAGPPYRIKSSLVIAQTDQLRVVDLTLAPGESVPWHRHPDSDDYIICLRGQLEVREGEPDCVTALQPLDRHVVAKGRPHATLNRSEQDCQFLIVQGPGRVAFQARPETGTGPALAPHVPQALDAGGAGA